MCDASKWCSGYKCRGGNYPDWMQGQYLAPEDAPHWECTHTGGFCCEEDCPEGEDYWYEHGENDWPEWYHRDR